MSESELKLDLSDSAATEALGVALADALPAPAPAPRDAPEIHGNATVVYLKGELGVGKTTCARSLLHALGVVGIVRSPTYTLVESYAGDRIQCIHVDLYRLRGPQDLEDLGLRDTLTPGNLLLIEWPERGGAELPPADLVVNLAYRGDGREAILQAHGPRGARWVENLRADSRLIPYLSN
ncbi:MAG TPA: tRNA (adenosine(37)-N6)-threonylcarbamoyltransferase complex ATPase subunit type 1 TsaE [Steroidobacteraceae bacterium]|nr:tRNA (adenosine(37)-N6)-threonylcarbamoyltransferase complex ATPase subunit type 1 TsaE [Steroidobacteraceae bacterium]